MPTEHATRVLLPGGGHLDLPAGADPDQVQLIADSVGNTPLIYRAIAAVMGDMTGVGKDDKAPEKMGGYQYRGIESVTRGLQTLCGKHGVIVWPVAKLIEAQPSAGMNPGWNDWRVEVTWSVAGRDGIALDPAPVTIGIGRDNTDKGINKAMTAAYKYLLLQLFMVSDGKDDPDAADTDHGRLSPQDVARQAEADRLAEDVKGLMAEVKGLTEPQRASIAQLWTTEDPMTGEALFPVGDDGKPKFGMLTAVMVPAVRAMVARVRKGEAPMPGALPPKDDPSGPADSAEGPQDGPGDGDGTDGAPEPSADAERPGALEAYDDGAGY